MEKVLMVLTSHDRLGDTGQPTGFWLEEFAAPYFVFRDAGVEVSIASPKGGQPPVDPKSAAAEFQTDATRRFKQDTEAQRALAMSQALSTVEGSRFDAIFFPGGHGPLWDLANDANALRLTSEMYAAGKMVAAVCHGTAVLLKASHGGAPLIQGRKVTGFSNNEEAAVGLTNVVLFLIQDEVGRLGGQYVQASDWEPFVVADGNLITGQNPASSDIAAHAVLKKSAAE